MRNYWTRKGIKPALRRTIPTVLRTIPTAREPIARESPELDLDPRLADVGSWMQ